MNFSKILLATSALVITVGISNAADTRMDKTATRVIESLPVDSVVTIRGEVSAVNGEKSFTLQDHRGETIGVYTNMPVNLAVGDKVGVNGMHESRYLGLSSAITGATVSVHHGAAKTADAMEHGKKNRDGAVDKLPKAGNIASIEGTVEKKVDEDTFILRDSTGDTVDVNTASMPLDVKHGDKVRVIGKMESEIAGIGQQIAASQVTRLK